MTKYIINSRENHLHTLIMLHGMSDNYKSLLEIAFKIHNKYKNIKIIIPNSPCITIDWPDGKETNVNSWYNYYTQNDNLMIHDNIDINQFNTQTRRIINIINNESKQVGSDNVILHGVSQGGTICFNILFKKYVKIKCFILIHTCLMNNIIDTKNITKNITNNKNQKQLYIFSGNRDNVYNLKLQQKSISKLYNEKYNETYNKKYNIYWHIEPNLNHCEYSKNEENFIIDSIKDYFQKITNYND